MIRAGLSALALAAVCLPAAAAENLPAPVGTRVADFARPDAATGKSWALNTNAKDAKATVVVFLGVGCPASTAYGIRLAELHKKYSEKGVAFVGVNSVGDDDAAAVAKHAKGIGIPFPVLKDDGTTLADKFAVDRVPAAFVLDATKTARYRGRIDDQFGPNKHRPKPTTTDLADALDAVLAGTDVKNPATPVAGCILPREEPAKAAAANPVTYHKHASRVFAAKCQECHRAGEAAPFVLTNFKTAKNWAGMIREVLADGTMPPWHADAPPGHFKNDRRLTADEKATLVNWIDQGCPEGDPKDAPAALTFVDGWRLPKTPDMVLKLKKASKIPAQALSGMGMPYSYIEVGEPFEKDTYVTAVEVRPDYRAVVHHIIAFVMPPGMSPFELGGPEFGKHMLGAYVPGDQPTILPPNHTRKIVKGSQIVFELHYTPNGKAGTDQSMIGIVTADGPAARDVGTMSIMNGKFSIPPGATRHEVKAEYAFFHDITVMSYTPHMHLRGKSFKYELESPGGSRELLLNVPKYEFNWQVSYDPTTPKVVPAGHKIKCTAEFDNSTSNPFNPDATKKVRWGNQTWDEMMIGFVMYSKGK